MTSTAGAPVQPVVLVVEDDRSVARCLARALMRSGADPTVVGNGQEAIDGLADVEYWDGASVDLNLGRGLTGLDVLGAFRKLGSQAPAVVVTGTWDKEIAREVQALGAEFVPKPFKPRNIEAFVAKATAYANDPNRMLRRQVARAATQYRLCARQEAILAGIAHGQTNEEIAASLELSPATVKWHNQRLFKALAVRSRTEALAALEELDRQRRGA